MVAIKRLEQHDRLVSRSGGLVGEQSLALDAYRFRSSSCPNNMAAALAANRRHPAGIRHQEAKTGTTARFMITSLARSSGESCFFHVAAAWPRIESTGDDVLLARVRGDGPCRGRSKPPPAVREEPLTKPCRPPNGRVDPAAGTVGDDAAGGRPALNCPPDRIPRTGDFPHHRGRKLPRRRESNH